MPPASIVFGLWHVPRSKKVEEIIVSWTWWGAPQPPKHHQQIIVLSPKTRRALLWAMILQKVSEEKSQAAGGIQCFTRRPLICNTSTSKRRSIFEECGNWYRWQNCRHSTCNIYHFRRINLSRLAFTALCSRLVLPSTFCSTAVVAAVGEGIYFGFYKTNALKKTAHKT